MKKKGRPKSIKKGKMISVLISHEQHCAISRAARSQSNDEGKIINFSEMVRRGLETTFPVNKTLDMFKK